MSFRSRQLKGWGILVAAALAGAAWLLSLDFERKVTTDVLELIPADSRVAELAIVRQLASQAEARTMLFALSNSDGTSAPVEAARGFARELASAPAFRVALAQADAAPQETIGPVLFEHRFALLFPQWLDARHGGSPSEIARGAVADLNRFLNAPEALAWQDLIGRDPLLLLPSATRSLDAGPLAAPTATGLVWAQLAASPLTEEAQKPAFDAIDRALEKVRAEFPGITVQYTGVNRFAAASRDRIQGEVFWLNTVSLVGVLAVAFLFIRTVRRGLHFLPVMGMSILGAWVGATAVFDRLHIIVFVVGSLLTGAAIDYGFYLFMQPPARDGEDYWDKVRRLARPLLASCFTTVAGFGLLLFSDLPMIRQLGVFVSAGLVSALAAAVVYFSTVRDPFLPTREFKGGRALGVESRRLLARALLVLWLLALPGLARLTWRDDIRQLEIASPDLRANDERLRELFGRRAGSAVYLTHGSTLQEARAALADFERWLAEAGGGRTRHVNLGPAVPTERQFSDAAAFVRSHPDFPGQLRAELERGGFDAAEFEEFFNDYQRTAASLAPGALEPAVAALLKSLTGPAALLAHSGGPVSWLTTIAVDPPSGNPPANTIEVRQLESLNRVFAQYRQSALWLSLAGLAIVGAGVFLMYGWRDGTRIFAIPCGVCLGVFGVLGWLGQPLNLFHLLGAFLGVCLTHNYSIFTAASAFKGEPPPVSVRLSALTTAASFGALALSGIPVVRALGITVLAIVLGALVMIELEHLGPLKRHHG